MKTVSVSLQKIRSSTEWKNILNALPKKWMRAFIYFKLMVIKYQAIKSLRHNAGYEFHIQLWHMLIAFSPKYSFLCHVIIKI